MIFITSYIFCLLKPFDCAQGRLSKILRHPHFKFHDKFSVGRLGILIGCIADLMNCKFLFDVKLLVVEVWRCGGVEVWRCGGMEVWSCGVES